MKLTLLVDADILVYKHSDAAQHVTDWGEDDGGVTVTTDSLEEVQASVEANVANMMEKYNATDIVLAFTDQEGVQYRKVLLPTYKASRRVKPVLYFPLRDWMMKTWRSYLKPTLEGDDVLGILATHPKLIRGPKLVVSIDKDMKQIPGTLANPGKDTITKVSVEEADYFHYLQTLTGDPVDEYKGCPGIGPVKAAVILAQNGNPWDHIVAAYAAKGLTEADALVQARVARILRHTDFNFKTQEPRLWTPPK